MSYRRSGLNPLAYQGVEPITLAADVAQKRAPTQNDTNFNLSTRWLDTTNETIWVLVNLDAGIATWVMLTGGSGTVTELTGNTGGAVPPLMGNINVLGDTTVGLTVSGSPSTNTLTITSNGGIPFGQTLTGDTGGAVPFSSAGNITTHGAHGLNTVGTPGTNTMTFAINNAITLGDLTPLAANAGALTATTGDVIITAGDLTLPNTNAAGNQGIIKFGGSPFISNYGTSNVYVGGMSGNTTTTGAGTNTAVGYNTLSHITTTAGNTAIGQNALSALTSGGPNTAVGSGALQDCTTGGSNVAVGFTCMQDATSANFNTAMGLSSLEVLTSGTNNTSIGYIACQLLTTGSYNTALGQNAGSSYSSTESSNIVIANGGTTGESNTIRIGTQGAGNGQQNVCFIAGIRGTTTVNANAIAVLVDSAGQLGTVSSSIRFKENIRDMDSDSDSLMKLRPVSFNYKSDVSKAPSWGLIAEEVEEHMPRLVIKDDSDDPETVKYHELPVLLLNELQKQSKIIEALTKRIKKLECVLQ